MVKTHFCTQLFTIKKNLLYLLLVTISFIPGYVLVRYGFNFSDEPYQILNTMDIHRSPMAPLTSWLSGLLGSQTNFSWMSYRYLAVTLNNLGFIIGGFYLYKCCKSLSVTSITCAVLIFLSGISRTYHNLFGWDSWTSFFIVVLVYCLMTYIDHPNCGSLITLSIFSSLTCLVRVPNIVLIPILWTILLYLSIKYSKKYKGYSAWIYVGISITIIVISLSVLYGSIETYLNDLRGNTLSNHSLNYLLWPLHDSLINLFFVISFFTVIVKCVLYAKDRGRVYGTIVLFLSCSALLWLLYMDKVQYILYDVY